MKSILMLLASTAILLASCNDKIDNKKVTLDKHHIEVVKGKSGWVYMLDGNGAYTTTFSHENIAEAVTEYGTVKVKGLNYGTTTVTITDRNNSSDTLRIDVVQTLSGN